jgi:pimeloyl-ACP methyl ester carboxylesterase
MRLNNVPEFPDGVEVYVRYYPPIVSSNNLFPTLFVNLNGMTYTTESYNNILPLQLEDGDGVLLLDFIGQGRTEEAHPTTAKIPYNWQTQILAALLSPDQGLRIPASQHKTLFGLSYGGAIALDYLAKSNGANITAVLAAPYTEPPEQVDQKIRQQIYWMNFNPLFASLSFEEKVEFLLWQDIFLYPTLEPSMLNAPYREAYKDTHQLVSGIHFFRGEKLLPQLAGKQLYGINGGKDQYMKKEIEKFFEQAWAAGALKGQLTIPESEHKISESAPLTLVNYLRMIARKDARIFNQKRHLEAASAQGVLRSVDQALPELAIPTPKEVVRSNVSVWQENLNRLWRTWLEEGRKHGPKPQALGKPLQFLGPGGPACNAIFFEPKR